jgi:predicted pyridoxine 5'-phosphate oxidase superfamily flavin-nucleotide-binding protein
MEFSPDVLETIKLTEFTAITTIDADGTPYLVGGWNCIPIGPDELLVSGERYVRTRENLRRDPRIWMLIATREHETGYRFTGEGQVSESPEDLVLVRKYWPRCSFAIRIRVTECEDLIYWRRQRPPRSKP